MFCYGNKESWYKKIVPSGMLPAVQIDGQTITESDEIVEALESTFGPLNGQSMNDDNVKANRKLERELFSAWCQWLCYQARSENQENGAKNQFISIAKKVERQLEKTQGPYFLDEFGTSDLIFVPYVERMNASLFYFKGYDLRKEHPKLGQWFDAMETRECYRGSQSDFITHAHDLPPQMGGCYFKFGTQFIEQSNLVDNGPYLDVVSEVNPVSYPEQPLSKEEAAFKVIKHHESISKVNPYGAKAFDSGMRAALTYMLTGKVCSNIDQNSHLALRYVRDRISVPRDMNVWSAKRLRQACEDTASLIAPQ